jgi:hypothetical protein
MKVNSVSMLPPLLGTIYNVSLVLSQEKTSPDPRGRPGTPPAWVAIGPPGAFCEMDLGSSD